MPVYASWKWGATFGGVQMNRIRLLTVNANWPDSIYIYIIYYEYILICIYIYTYSYVAIYPYPLKQTSKIFNTASSQGPCTLKSYTFEKIPTWSQATTIPSPTFQFKGLHLFPRLTGKVLPGANGSLELLFWSPELGLSVTTSSVVLASFTSFQTKASKNYMPSTNKPHRPWPKVICFFKSNRKKKRLRSTRQKKLSIDVHHSDQTNAIVVAEHPQDWTSYIKLKRGM